MYCLHRRTDAFVCGVGEDSWDFLGQQGHQTCQSWRKSTLTIHWKDWCWSPNTLATWCKEPTHWKRLLCWERLKAGGEEDDRGWDGWMASPTQWTWVWVSCRRWWRIGKPGVLQPMGSQRVGHSWRTEQKQPLFYGYISRKTNHWQDDTYASMIQNLGAGGWGGAYTCVVVFKIGLAAGHSLSAQWLGLPPQGARVPSLVGELKPSCLGQKQ